ncbi:zinc finger BED domain-containing protein RICESLEEPER 2 [Tanacetum coccineum]
MTKRSRRGNAFLNSFKDKVGNKLSGGEDELKKYLKEPRLELEDDEDFDILTWWKVIIVHRFSNRSKDEIDILCIQVSTVASESAFSVSGRVLDPYRNSFEPHIVEALVCAQHRLDSLLSRTSLMDKLEICEDVGANLLNIFLIIKEKYTMFKVFDYDQQ